MIDTQKAVHTQCIKLDDFGDKNYSITKCLQLKNILFYNKNFAKMQT